MSPDELARHTRTLNDSRDRDTLAASAVTLAASEDPAAILALGGHLRQREFLARLDDLSEPGSAIEHFGDVFRALAEHPTPETGRLCELLYGESGFREISSRINFLLAALAAVRPTTPGGAEVFRATSAEGFAEVNGPLLIRNQSLLALGVFEALIAGDWVDTPPKVQILHRAVLPQRTSPPVLRICVRLLDMPLAPEVRVAMIETLFDYQSRRWYGPVLVPPVPPPWESASNEVLEMLLALADRVLASPTGEELHPAVRSTRRQLEGIRRARMS